MKTYDVQSVSLEAPCDVAFDYIADPENLPEWTLAFKKVAAGRAMLATPRAAVEISLAVAASREHGTIDWSMAFPDGSVARAYSRVTANGARDSVFTFLLSAPPVPLEQIEGALEEQSRILSDELARLAEILSMRAKAAPPGEA